MFGKLKDISILILACIPFWLGSCEIDVKHEGETRNYKIFSSGKWAVEKFDSPSANYLSAYSGYELMFSSGGSVTALLAGAVSGTGTWTGSTDKYAIEINFAGVDNPLKRLNGIWAIYYGSQSAIRATRTEGTELYTLWLKQV